MKARVSGLGLWVPPEVRTNDAWSPAFIAAARERGDRLLVDIPAAGDGLDAITADIRASIKKNQEETSG